MYGRVDQVVGHFYVVTQFFHLWYIPLIPLQTYLAVEGSQTDDEFRGVKMPLSIKSVTTAYLRAAFLVIGIIMLIRSGMLLFEESPSMGPNLMVGVMSISIAIFCGVAFWASYHVLRADEQKAKMLAQYLKSPQ